MSYKNYHNQSFMKSKPTKISKHLSKQKLKYIMYGLAQKSLFLAFCCGLWGQVNQDMITDNTYRL